MSECDSNGFRPSAHRATMIRLFGRASTCARRLFNGSSFSDALSCLSNSTASELEQAEETTGLRAAEATSLSRFLALVSADGSVEEHIIATAASASDCANKANYLLRAFQECDIHSHDEFSFVLSSAMKGFSLPLAFLVFVCLFICCLPFCLSLSLSFCFSRTVEVSTAQAPPAALLSASMRHASGRCGLSFRSNRCALRGELFAALPAALQGAADEWAARYGGSVRLPCALLAFLADAEPLHIIGALEASPVTSLCLLAIDSIAEVPRDFLRAAAPVRRPHADDHSRGGEDDLPRSVAIRFFVLTPYAPYAALRAAWSGRAAPFRGGEGCEVLLAYTGAAPEVWGRAVGRGDGGVGELFFIARCVEDYLRLGAAFAWVYGWQLCYAARGPPQRSLPWLKLLAPGALAAALSADA